MSGIAALLAELLPVVVFGFGAVSFIILAVSYWRNRARRTSPFGVFSVACAGAFLTNLASALLLAEGWVIVALQSICTGLLPPLMLHVVIDMRPGGGSHVARPSWRVVLLLTYITALVLAVARGLTPEDWLDTATGVVLAAVAGLVLVHVILRPVASASEKHERRWIIGIFSSLLCCAVAQVANDYPVLAITPDYLVLMFFAVRLYYSERLAFFDVFLKGGTYFAAGLVVLTLAAAVGAAGSARFGTSDRVWLVAFLLMPAWLLAPSVNRLLGDWIDRRVLKRRYSPVAAETMFSQTLQSAATEEQLLERATETLQVIFGCPVDVARDGDPIRSQPGDLVASIVPSGTVHLYASRRPGPFLSEEQRLLQALTVILGSSLHTLQVRRLREEQRVREEELQALATRAELRALRAQINPHFLFNALNAVAGCIRTRPEVADDTLTQLAEVFRYTLTRSEKEWVRLGEELDFLRSYLAVEQTRFGDRLRVTIDADRSANSVMVPAMILQPIVENAIKHGTSRLNSTGEVGINVCLSAGGLLRIMVSDNGPGFQPVLSVGQLDRGHGLRNVAERLHRHYGDAGKLQWQNEAGSTIVTIQIPSEAVRQCAC